MALTTLDIPAKLTTEIIAAEINDIIFRIFSPFLILRVPVCAEVK